METKLGKRKEKGVPRQIQEAGLRDSVQKQYKSGCREE